MRASSTTFVPRGYTRVSLSVNHPPPSTSPSRCDIHTSGCELHTPSGDWERLSLLICPKGVAATAPGDQEGGHGSIQPDEGEVHAALFSQHNFDSLYNCTAGECDFEHYSSGLASGEASEDVRSGDAPKAAGRGVVQPQREEAEDEGKNVGKGEGGVKEDGDEQHIVVYSALHSHAVYPKAKPSTIVYGQVWKECGLVWMEAIGGVGR